MSNTDFFADPEETSELLHYPKWTTNGTYKFVTGYKEELDLLYNDFKKKVALGGDAPQYFSLDLESTGLNVEVIDGTTVSQIVGFCVSIDGTTGYYFPTGHDLYKNVPLSEVRDFLIKMWDIPQSVTIFHNSKYDMQLLEYMPGAPKNWTPFDKTSRFEDTLIISRLGDTVRASHGLKKLSAEYLAMEMFELVDIESAKRGGKKVKRNEITFKSYDPEWKPCRYYAGADAICTYKLFKALRAKYGNYLFDGNSGAMLYSLEKNVVRATLLMENSYVAVDFDVLEDSIKTGQDELFSVIQKLYNQFNVLLGRDIRPKYIKILMGDILGYEHMRFEPNSFSYTIVQGHRIPRTIMSALDDARTFTKKEDDSNKKNYIKKKVRKLKVGADGTWGEEAVNFQSIYNIMSTQQFGLLLREIGVKGLSIKETDAGNLTIQTGKEFVEALIEQNDMPLLSDVLKWRQIEKALNGYLIPFYKDALPRPLPDGGTFYGIRPQFDPTGASTGRFTAKTSKNPMLHGGTSVSFQGLPALYDKTKPACMRAIRTCLVARSSKFKIAAIDYSGAELRILTFLTGNEPWKKTFFECSSCGHVYPRNGDEIAFWVPRFCIACGSDKIGDIHSQTAVVVFGPNSVNEPGFKLKRNNCKAINFGLAYGGGAGIIEKALNCDKNEAQRIKAKLDLANKENAQWQKQRQMQAKQLGYVETAIHRRRFLPDATLDRRQYSMFVHKAMRDAVNAPVQGTNADITKAAMAFIYKKIKKNKWEDKLYVLATIHDEIVFDIHEDIFEEAIDMIEATMVNNVVTRNFTNTVPFVVDTEVGDNWAVEHNLSEMTAGLSEWDPELKRIFKRDYFRAPPAPGSTIETRVKMVNGRNVYYHEGELLGEPLYLDSEQPCEPPADGGDKTPIEVKEEPITPTEPPPSKAPGSVTICIEGEPDILYLEILGKILRGCHNTGSSLVNIVVKDVDITDLFNKSIRHTLRVSAVNLKKALTTIDLEKNKTKVTYT